MASRLSLRRSASNRVVVGVAGGVGERTGIEPTIIRVALIVLCLASGLGFILYALAWALSSGPSAAPQARLRTTDGQLRQVIAVSSIVAGILLAARAVGLWVGDAVGWPLALAAFGASVIWVRSERSEAHAQLDPLAAVFAVQPVLRLATGGLFVLSGMLLVLQSGYSAGPAGALPLVVAVLGLTLIFGPWLYRLAQQLADERRERIRTEERSDMAAHLHDSVLQTLALIQRTTDASEMVGLARVQERELRAWLFGAPRPDLDLLSAAVEAMASRVESQHRIAVETVVVGDAEIDESIATLLDAMTEATLNSAKHSGAESVSAFIEVEESTATAYVRDKGCGFDPRLVPEQRGGIAESIRSRMERHGGRAEIISEPGKGTEVKLQIARTD
ncbi:MAG: PspC domain-containing protein [Actinobacteria bacterium]|nr:PspC domain-containing protein [Actinomycetota bacterium]